MDSQSPGPSTDSFDLPGELSDKLEHLASRLARSPLGQYAHVDRKAALRIALARGLEAFDDDERSPLA